MDEKKEGKQANLQKTKTMLYHHDIPRKRAENEKALVIFIGDSAATSHMTSNNGSLQSDTHKRVSNDWKWEEHQLHPLRKIGCHLQTQGWIHSQRNLGCENCARIEQ